MRSKTEGSVVRGWGRITRVCVTMLVAVAAFFLLAGPSCPLMGGGGEKPKVSKKAAKAVVEDQEEETTDEEAPAPVRSTSRKQATGKQESLEVGKLVLTDSSGDERARLEVFPDGAVGLTMVDNRGKERTFVGLESDGVPMYILRDDSGTDRARVYLGGDGTPMFDLMNKRGDVRASVLLNEGEDPMISLFDDRGTVKTSYYLQKNGDPVLSYLDSDGKEVFIVPQQAKVTTAPAPRTTPRTTTYVNPPPQQPQAKPHEASSVGETVVVIVKGKRPIYHLPSCPNLVAIPKEDKRRLLLKDVAAKGFMPCPMCRPPRYVP